MSVTLRFVGPPSPGYLDDGETWVDDLGHVVHLGMDEHVQTVTSGEAVTLDGDGWELVQQDPTVRGRYAPDAILLTAPSGLLIGLPRSQWEATGEPQSTAKDVLDRVDGDPARARIELAAEQAGQNRKGLTGDLQAIIDTAGVDPAAGDNEQQTPAGAGAGE